MNRKQQTTIGIAALALATTAAFSYAKPASSHPSRLDPPSHQASASTSAVSSSAPQSSSAFARTSTSHTSKKQSADITLPRVDPHGVLPGYLLIADRGNSRLLIVTPDKKVVWHMEMAIPGPHNENSRGADDAFITPDGRHIITNEEENHVIAIIDIATKKVVWTYGHAATPGSLDGYLNTPDDAYELPDGTITVADIRNQRILFMNRNGKILKQYGQTGRRYHHPPTSFAAPNGDTPLPDGGMLVTEIGGSYADRLDKNGKVVYTVHFKDIGYPSDTQLLANGHLLVVDYNTPGRVEEVDQSGHIVWEYYKESGPGMLANPSLAIALPNGNVALNDDYNDRIVIINPKTNQIVWQYGTTNRPGTGPNHLNVPDGVDFIPPTWKLPTL